MGTKARADGRARGALLYNYTGERTRAVANLSDNLPEIVEQVPSSLEEAEICRRAMVPREGRVNDEVREDT